MQANAAAELLELVEAWDSPGTIEDIRGPEGDTELLWRSENRAVHLLAEVEAFLETRNTSGRMTGLITGLRRFVFATDAVWANNGMRIADAHLAQLDLVAQLMGASAPSTPRMSDADLDALRRTVQNCLDVLESEAGDLEERADYVRELLGRCMELLDGEPVDLLALRDLSFQATGAVTAIAVELPDESRKKLGHAFIALAAPWMFAMSSGAVGGFIGNLSSGALLPPGS